MSTLSDLQARSESKCELCDSTQELDMFLVPASSNETSNSYVLACKTCRTQMQLETTLDIHHWRCLNQSMWSQVPAVQVVVWRMLNTLSDEAWAQDALDMLYLDEETLAWAKADKPETNEHTVVHKDANGATLSAGDTVTLIKDLQVKGAGFTAKRGTAVRNISLVQDNDKHIEGRVSGQQIVILTEFVKRS